MGIRFVALGKCVSGSVFITRIRRDGGGLDGRIGEWDFDACAAEWISRKELWVATELLIHKVVLIIFFTAKTPSMFVLSTWVEWHKNFSVCISPKYWSHYNRTNIICSSKFKYIYIYNKWKSLSFYVPSTGFPGWAANWCLQVGVSSCLLLQRHCNERYILLTMRITEISHLHCLWHYL